MSDPWTATINPLPAGELDEAALERLLTMDPARVLLDCDLFAQEVSDTDRAAVLACACLATQHSIFLVTEHAEEIAYRFADRSELDAAEAWAFDLTHPPHSDIPGSSVGDAVWELMPGCDMCIEAHDDWPLKNLWLGATVRTQDEADERLPHLARLAEAGWNVAAWCEPTEAIDLRYFLSDDGFMQMPRWVRCSRCGRVARNDVACPGCGCEDDPEATTFLGWLYCSVETGPDATPLWTEWVSDLRDQCKSAGVPFWGIGVEEMPEGVVTP